MGTGGKQSHPATTPSVEGIGFTSSIKEFEHQGRREAPAPLSLDDGADFCVFNIVIKHGEARGERIFDSEVKPILARKIK